MSVEFTERGLSHVNFVLGQIEPDIHEAIVKKMSDFTVLLWDRIVNEKLSGQVLNMRSGRLARSIKATTTDVGGVITGTVFSDGSVPYAAIHEYGGKTGPHDIFMVGAPEVFMVGAEEVFATIVHHPGSIIPERSYMRSALSDLFPEIMPGFEAAIAAKLEGR